MSVAIAQVKYLVASLKFDSMLYACKPNDETKGAVLETEREFFAAFDRALTEAYADGRKDQREEDATIYAAEQVETARSLEQMRD